MIAPKEYWVQPSAKYTIKGTKPWLCPTAIEIHSFSTPAAPEVIRVIIRQEGESAYEIWKRALDTMLELKRARPFNASMLPHGKFHFRYGKLLDATVVEASISYRNIRLAASWTANNISNAADQLAGRILLSEIRESAAGSSLERVLANLELAVLDRVLSRASLRPLLEWAEMQRLATPLDDWTGQEAIGCSLARCTLALLTRKAPPVATLQ